MKKQMYQVIENFMLEKMNDAAHDKFHIYRVLNSALEIARHTKNVDAEILTAACLLHDIGRDAQAKDPTLCHAQVGAEMAYQFLSQQGWQANRALHVRDCISSHRFRGDNAPETIEAKILFDADKLDVTGTVGIARTLIYCGQAHESLYNRDEDGKLITHKVGKETTSFVEEYNHKLKRIHKKLYTKQAKKIAKQRQKAAKKFYNALLEEI